jgi:hypothetical protein
MPAGNPTTVTAFTATSSDTPSSRPNDHRM